MSHERWQRLLRLIDDAFEEYLTGMAVLRKRVVHDVKRKVRYGDYPAAHSTSRRSRAKKRP